MPKPYTLRKTRSGLRIMTLSPALMTQMLSSHVDAARFALDLTFREIERLTGDKVCLSIDQEDALRHRLDEAGALLDSEAYIAWRWMLQGARVADTRDLAHLLQVAQAAITALAALGDTTP